MLQARNFAKEAGLSQDQFSKLLSLNAANQIGTAAMLKSARDAEVTKLGAAGSARVTAVENFIQAQLGDDLGKAMKGMLVTAKHVEGFEKLMAAFRSQGAGSFNQGGRQPNEPSRVDDKAYDNMSYSEKKNYAAAHQANGRGN